MDAIVLAGGRPKPEEPLFPHTQGGYKSLLDIAGKPMIQWVLDALGAAPSVDNVVVVGLPVSTPLSFPRPYTALAGEDDLLRNIQLGAKALLNMKSSSPYALLVSSDIPGITPEIVEWEMHTVLESDHDIYYNIIERLVMEKVFPGSRRSYYHLKGGMEVCGGDLNAIRTEFFKSEKPLWGRIIAARKNAFQQAALIGFDTLLWFLLRQFTPESAAARVSKRLKLNGRVIICPYAPAGMDVDKPSQLEMLRAYLARR